MKTYKQIIVTALVTVLVVSLLFMTVENIEQNVRAKKMFRSCISVAADYFDEYMSTGNEHKYHDGVREVYGALILSIYSSDNDKQFEEISLYLNKCYSCLTDNPNESKAQLKRLVTSMKQYSDDESMGAFGVNLNSFANSVTASSKSE